MADISHTTLHLYKQNFKFSSAHFLIFDEKRAEMLHGHNYQVRVDIAVPTSESLKNTGYFIDFNIFKKQIKNTLDQWDEHVLMPAQNKEFKFTEKSTSIEIKFRDRFYVFPKNEVVLLPITNTSVEQLSRLLAEEFMNQFYKYSVKKIRVAVEETRGQSASFVLKSSL